jgi:multicomponent Na+:H+ antiporter subunit D
MSDALLPFLVLAPLLGAAVAVGSGRAAPGAAAAVAVAMPVAVALLAMELLRAGTLVHAAGGWGAPLGIELRADGLALLLLATTAVIGSAITLYSMAYFTPVDVREGDRGVRFFWPLWLLVWSALNAVFVSADLFNLYVCLELLTLPAVALVGLDGTREAVAAAARYLLVSIAASLVFLLGVAIVYTAAGTLSIHGAAATPLPASGSGRLALTLMTVGLTAKAALFPLHFWLPPAHARAPAPASAVLSALVVKAGFYIILRIWVGTFPAALVTGGAVLLGVLGAGAIIWGSLVALRQTTVKLLIAWSTVAQVGYLFLVFPLLHAAPAAAWSGAMYHLLAHALAKAALFLAAGSMIRALGDDSLHSLAGVGQKLPLTFAAFGIAGLNLVGLPPSGGFIGKWLLLTAAVHAGQWWWAVVLLLGSLLAAGYVLLVLRTAFLQPAARPLRQQPPWPMTTAALALAALSLALGLWAELPLTLLGAAAPAMGH